MDKQFVKLSDLVGKTITVEAVKGYKFKKWEENKMVVADRYFEGAQKKWLVETDKGAVDMSSSQLGTLLEGVHKSGESNLINETFQVKSNGKTGMEIRYFFNHIAEWQGSAMAQTGNTEQVDDDEVDLSEAPF